MRPPAPRAGTSQSGRRPGAMPRKRQRRRERRSRPFNTTSAQRQRTEPAAATKKRGRGNEPREASVKTGLRRINSSRVFHAWIGVVVDQMTRLHYEYTLFVAIAIAALLPANLAISDAGQYPPALCSWERGLSSDIFHIHATKVGLLASPLRPGAPLRRPAPRSHTKVTPAPRRCSATASPTPTSPPASSRSTTTTTAPYCQPTTPACSSPSWATPW